MRPYLTLHHPGAAKAYYKAGLWQQDTFYSLLRHNAEAAGNRVALVDSRRRLTWAELKAWVDGIAADLRTFGLREGDRISGWMSGRAEGVALMLACSREGFAYHPSLHRSHTCAEVGTFLQLLGTRAFVAEAGWGADRGTASLDAVLAGVPSLKVMYDVENLPPPAPNRTPWSRDPDKIVYLAFTSGTTGAPKCVMHSDNTLLANARELVRDWHHNDSTVILTLSPLSHHIAWVAFSQWLVAGCRLVTNDPPPGRSILDWIVETGATYLMGVPTHAIDLLAEQERRGCSLGSVSTFYMAGASIPRGICEALIDQGITPQNVYGMTENSSHHYTLPHDPPETIVDSCGRGGHAYQIRIFDPSDRSRELPPGQVGEIGGRGAALMLGYFGSQTATESGFNDDGWFMSGDLGMLDAHGNLRIVGRLKDTIIRGGHNIYPAHIEEVALRHKEVRQAACFPVPDMRLGERCCLAVTGTAEREAILRHLRNSELSRYDIPEFFLHLDAFPLTSSGKILKRRLVEMVKRRELVPEAIAPPSGSGSAGQE